jgi:hypothetical protein
VDIRRGGRRERERDRGSRHAFGMLSFKTATASCRKGKRKGNRKKKGEKREKLGKTRKKGMSKTEDR